jgi:hypothetical protein
LTAEEFEYEWVGLVLVVDAPFPFFGRAEKREENLMDLLDLRQMHGVSKWIHFSDPLRSSSQARQARQLERPGQFYCHQTLHATRIDDGARLRLGAK